MTATITVGPVATDNFTRADNANLGANWSVVQGGIVIAIESNAAKGYSTSAEYWTGAGTFNNDQYSQLTLTTFTGSAYASTFVRVSAAGGYFCRAEEGYQNEIRKFSTDWQTTSVLTSSSSNLFVAGDVMKCEVVGTTINLRKNGAIVLTTTDSTYNAGAPGIASFYVRMNSWSGGNQ
jgi:hypothetical protein